MQKQVAIILVGFWAAFMSSPRSEAAQVNPGEQLTELFKLDFQNGVNPFSGGSTSGGSTALLSDFLSPGNYAVEFQDTNQGESANRGTTFTYGLTTSNDGKDLVDAINAVLTSPAGTSAEFIFEWELERTIASNAPVPKDTGRAVLQTSPNDGNPPAGGLGRDRFWIGDGEEISVAAQSPSDYNIGGGFALIDNSMFPMGGQSQPHRGYRFKITSDGSSQTITGMGLGFSVRVDSFGTPEAYAVDNIRVYQVTAIPEPASLLTSGMVVAILGLRRQRLHR